MARSPVLVVAAALLAAAAVAAADWSSPPPPPGRGRAADGWLALLSDIARGGTAESADDDWFPRPIPVSLPIGRGGAGGRSATVPVLILPIPVPAPEQSTAAQCETVGSKPQTDQGFHSLPKGSSGAKSSPRPFEPAAQSPGPHRQQSAALAPTPAPSPPQPDQSSYYGAGAEEPAVPHLDYVVSSQQLVELFQTQVAPQPELPPAVIPDYAGGGGDAFAPLEPGPELAEARGPRPVRMRRYQLQPSAARAPAPAPAPTPESTPAPPRFERSLMLRGVLTVPRAGYSEPYTVWWDARSGAARVDLHGGASSSYRTLMPDGRVRHLEMRVDRSGAAEGEVRRCARGAPRPPAPEDRALPALPDLHAFAFTGYVESEFGRVERWAHTVSGDEGQLGGARGEALSFRHDLLLTRAHANSSASTPLKYSVSVDSSVLGANCDGYVHRYTEIRDQQHEAGFFVLDLVESCDEVAAAAAARERVEPLREFTLSHRDPRYDALYAQFKSRHARRYMDDTEEAVRKNLLVQHSRFVSSGNRQGATFSMEMNHLSDRLDAELGVLRGVREERGAGGAGEEPFPHARDELAAGRARLPRHFDWRQHGAVTHVRNQGSCSSCWAFAVTGAVEGALFLRTRTLVPLSEQCLVDCAHPFGGHGCGGTWPSAAYSYVQERGLPPLDEYTPYHAEVGRCEADRVSPVTHISAHVNVTRNDVDALKMAIRRHAPTVVIIDSTPKSFVFYKKGVIRDERCAKNKAEHAVLAVGWGVRRGGEEHILVKNSWSAAWGEAGYARLQARANTCGVLSRPSYPRLERADVDRLPPAAPPAPLV